MSLGAQGLTAPRPQGRVDRRHLRAMLSRVGVVQLDSVNVVARAHHLLVWARLGAHNDGLIHRWAYGSRPPEVFEYPVHEASLVPVTMQPLMRWRMAEARGGRTWKGLANLARDRASFVRDVLAKVEARGPVSAGELRDGERRAGSWWGWDDSKKALEWLFRCGELAAVRRASFERVYDIPERVLPTEVLTMPSPDPDDARRALLAQAAQHLGVATLSDLADYHRIRVPDARPRVAELVEEGVLSTVKVQGWTEVAYLHAGAVVPRRLAASTLLSPFDPLVWYRPRAERLFGFRYRIEIYTPAHQRTHGYYVLPFLHRDGLRARVDVKADRAAARLVVRAAWLEQGEDEDDVAPALVRQLDAMACWLGLEAVAVEDRGDLAPALAAAVSASS